MSAYYFDSSAIVKRYISEVGMTWVMVTSVKRFSVTERPFTMPEWYK